MNEFPIGEMVAATGALGVAAMGIVEALKVLPVGQIGFGKLRQLLGVEHMKSISLAYGDGYEQLLASMYRKDRSGKELRRALRQGLRLGLTEDNAPALQREINVLSVEQLTALAAKIQAGEELADEQRSQLARYELAVDSRIDAALALADTRYTAWLRLMAMGVAVILAAVAAFFMQPDTQGGDIWIMAAIVGLAAVPLAPVAKDVSRALQEATRAIGAGQRSRGKK